MSKKDKIGLLVTIIVSAVTTIAVRVLLGW